MYLIKTIMAMAIFCFATFVYAEININIATAQQLTELNNIGVVKATAIVEYRTKHGNFQSVDDLLNVDGIGMAILELNRDMLTVTAETARMIPPNPATPAREYPPAEKHLSNTAPATSDSM